MYFFLKKFLSFVKFLIDFKDFKVSSHVALFYKTSSFNYRTKLFPLPLLISLTSFSLLFLTTNTNSNKKHKKKGKVIIKHFPLKEKTLNVAFIFFFNFLPSFIIFFFKYTKQRKTTHTSEAFSMADNERITSEKEINLYYFLFLLSFHHSQQASENKCGKEKRERNKSGLRDNMREWVEEQKCLN